MTDFENGLSHAEAERLALLAEESAEVIQVVGKILRHGYESVNPTIKHSLSNRYLLEKEIGHLYNVVDMMLSCNDVNVRRISTHKKDKALSISQWLHNQEVEK